MIIPLLELPYTRECSVLDCIDLLLEAERGMTMLSKQTVLIASIRGFLQRGYPLLSASLKPPASVPTGHDDKKASFSVNLDNGL